MDIIDIKSTNALAHSRSAENYNYHKDIVKGTETDMAQIPAVEPSFNIYKARVEKEGLIFKLSPESEETVKITSLNKKRVADWRLIIRLLDHYAENGEGAELTAAQHLNHVLKTYKGLTEANLFAKTGYISDAIDALKKPSAQAAINLIPGLLPLVDKMEERNTELDDLYIKRAQDKGLVHGLGTLSDYRPQVDKAFLELVDDINSTYRLNQLSVKDAALKAAIEKVANTITSLYSKLLDVLAHHGKKPQQPDIDNPEVPGDGGDSGDGGEPPGGGTENPDIENPPAPPFIPDFE